MKKVNLAYVFFCIVLLAFVAIYCKYEVANHNAESEMDYYAYAESLDLAEIIDSPDLSMEMIENRNGNLIIERIVGVVTNAETGDGYIIGWPDFYISYVDVKGISNGDVICSYLIYNPDNNYCDDVMLRFDYIIDDK